MTRAVAVLLCAAIALIAVELVLRSRTSPVRIEAPCAAHVLFPGHGVDAATQRVVLDGLGRAACSLDVTREALVLSFAGSSGDRLARPNAKVEQAVRAGLVDALDASVKRGEIPQLLALLLRTTIQHAPLDRLISGKLI